MPGTVAQYAIRVRDNNNVLVGELSNIHSAMFTLRYNSVSAWTLELDADDPLAPLLASDGYGIQVLRTLRDPETDMMLSSTVLFSGPRWGRVRNMAARTLIASGFDDMLRLQARQAWQVVSYPEATTILALPGLLRYYKLGETSGTTATDSKSAVNGTYTGGFTLNQTSLIDDPNPATLFNGSTGYVNLPVTSIPTGNGAYSAGCWFKTPSSFPSSSKLVSWGTWGTNKASPHLGINSLGQIFAGTFNGDTAPSASMATQSIHHGAMTYDGTTLICYLDGVETARTTPGTLVVVNAAAAIGSVANHSQDFYNGTIDEVFICSGALSAATISNIYSVGFSRFAAADSDTRTGAAETVIRQYVDVNCVSAINDPLGLSRVVPNLTLAADSGRGSTVTGNARDDFLVTPDGVTGLLQQLAQSGGMGFQVVQSGTNLQFSQYVPTDRTSTVIFSEAIGNLADYTYEEDGPDFTQGGNVIMVAGGGQGTNRLFILRADSTSISRWGRFEGYQDARDTSDVPTMQQRGDATLAASTTVTQFAATIAAQRQLVYGQDFNLGDKVTVVIDGVSFANIIREIQITLDAAGAETVVPAVGTPGSDTIRQVFGSYVQHHEVNFLRGQVSLLQRAQ